MYRTCTSYADQSACVADLARACQALCANLGLSDPDARWIALNNIATVAKGNQLVLNLLDSWHRGDESVRQAIPQLVGIQKVTPGAVQAAGDWLNGNSRLGFAVLAEFQIENLLRNLCRELGVDQPQGLYNLARSLLERLGLTQHLNTLAVPSLIRNSLHSNGIHRGYRGSSQSITVLGVTYDFRHGERVRCAGWEHIAHALEASVDVVGQILQHPLVAAVPAPMMDVYAWEVLTAPR